MHTPIFRAFTRALQRARQENRRAEGSAPPVSAASRRWSRRRFLGTTLRAAAVAGAGGALGGLEAALRGLDGDGAARAASGAPALEGARIAVIGGGLAGLSAAYRLQSLGFAPTVYEARAGVGGRIRSVRGPVGDDLLVELGAELVDSTHDDIVALTRELGLSLYPRASTGSEVPDTAYIFDGRAWSEEEVAEALRPLAAAIASDAARLDPDTDGSVARFDGTTAAAYLDAHAPAGSQPFVRVLVENAIRAELGVEPEETSALHLLFLLPTVDGEAVDMLGASDEAYVLAGGSSVLTDALAERLTGRIRLRTALRAVEPHGAAYRLRFEDGAEAVADQVILALPFAVLRHVALQVALPEGLRRMIETLDSGANEKIIAGFRSRPWRRAGGFRQEAWADLGFTEMWDATLRQPDRREGAMTFFLGGAQVAAMRAGTARERGRELVDRVDRVLPGWREAAADRWVRTTWGESRFSRGAYSTFRPGQYTAFAPFLWFEPEDPSELREVRAGNLHFAGEHLSGDFYGFMNGAAQTGRLAAQAVARGVAVGSGAGRT